MDIRSKCFQLCQQAAGTKQEHTAVPVIFPAGQITFCCRNIRLLNKLRHRKSLTLFSPTADIAITCLGMGRYNAKSHQLASLGMSNCLLHRRSKRSLITNDVIGSEYQQQGIFTFVGRLQRRQRR